jgi:hypothetical protein
MNQSLKRTLLRSWSELVRELKRDKTIWDNGMPTWSLWNEADIVWHLARELARHGARLPGGPLNPGCLHVEASLANRDDGTRFGRRRVDLAICDVGCINETNWRRWHALVFVEAKIVHHDRRTRGGFAGPLADAAKLREYLRRGLARAGVLMVVDQRHLPLKLIADQYRKLTTSKRPKLGALVFVQEVDRALALL